MLIEQKKKYSKDGVQGTNWYPEGGDSEKYRYNDYRLRNRAMVEAAYLMRDPLPFPAHVIIEVSSCCNFRCGFCNRDAGLKRPQMNMSLETFKKVVDQCAAGGVHSLSLYCLGEPMINPQIREMIVYAKGRGIPYVDISTNGSHDLVPLLGTSLNEVIISIDGFKEAHEKLRPGASWDREVAHLEGLYWAKRRGRYSWPVIRLQCIDLPETHADLPRFIDWGLMYADVVYIKRVEAFSQSLGIRNVPQAELDARLAARQPCKQLYFVLTVNADGTIAACCHDPHCRSVLGHIDGMTLDQAWKALAPARQRHFNADFSDFGGLCKMCVDWSW